MYAGKSPAFLQIAQQEQALNQQVQQQMISLQAQLTQMQASPQFANPQVQQQVIMQFTQAQQALQAQYGQQVQLIDAAIKQAIEQLNQASAAQPNPFAVSPPTYAPGGAAPAQQLAAPAPAQQLAAPAPAQQLAAPPAQTQFAQAQMKSQPVPVPEPAYQQPTEFEPPVSAAAASASSVQPDAGAGAGAGAGSALGFSYSRDQKFGQMMLRPKAGGVQGRKVILSANMFSMAFNPDMTVHHYDLDVKPEIKVKRVMRSLFETICTVSPFKESFSVHDGLKNIYVSRRLNTLPNDVAQFRLYEENGGWKHESQFVPVPGSDKKPKISVATIKLVATVPLSILDEFLKGRTTDMPAVALQALDIVLRYKLTQNATMVGRSFFTCGPGTVVDLTGGMDCWLGHYQSVRPSLQGLALNVDTSAAAMIHPEPVLDFLVNKLGLRGKQEFGPAHAKKAESLLKGLQVHDSHRKEYSRKSKVVGFGILAANKEMFELEGKKISVAQYFQDRYQVKLQFPNAPCIKIGSKDKPTLMPPEVMHVSPGQRVFKLNGQQTTNMLDQTCSLPAERASKISRLLPSTADDPYCKSFGIQIKPQMSQVNGRELTAPSLKYRAMGKGEQTTTTNVRNGAWRLDGLALLKTNPLSVCFAVCVGEKRFMEQRVTQFIKELIDISEKFGMPWKKEMPTIDYIRPDISMFRAILQKKLPGPQGGAFNTPGRPQLVLVFLPGKDPIYGELKRMCDTEYGLASQCFDFGKVRNEKKSTGSYQFNVMLKINAKMGGFHCTAPLPVVSREPTLVLGADVHHPGMGSASPSIAAVVGSYNADATLYASVVMKQQTRLEIVANMELAVTNLLKNFFAKTGKKPSSIIMFRDGVGEGQFQAVTNFEVAAIFKACSNLDPKYRPKLTFLLVQKRHHLRLFSGPAANLGNVNAGTVVDTQVVHPTENDFYLCSHAALKGTSSPSHYRVLLDDNKCSPDDIQGLAYALCHVYQRCARSVSIPAPAYYAHLAAYRGRFYCDNFDGSDTQSNISGDGNDPTAMAEPHLGLRDRLWYA